MTQPSVKTDTVPRIFEDFPLEMVTPPVRKEAQAILDCIAHARSIGRTRADIRNAGGFSFHRLDDIHPVTVAIFEWCNIHLIERTKAAAASVTMGYETPAVTILQAEWVEA